MKAKHFLPLLAAVIAACALILGLGGKRTTKGTLETTKSETAVPETEAPATAPETRPAGEEENERDYVANKNTLKFHYPTCSSVEKIKPSNRWDFHGIREELIAKGYAPCKRCSP